VLLQNLFEVYESCKDHSFVHYTQRMEQEHIDGNVFTPEALMDLALKQYQKLVQKKAWSVESAEQKEIMSLSAQIVTLRKKLDGPSKRLDVVKNNEKNKTTTEEWLKH
jgi:hypothetical protein